MLILSSTYLNSPLLSSSTPVRSPNLFKGIFTMGPAEKSVFRPSIGNLISNCAATLFRHVSHVICWGTKKQVVRVNTLPVVAPVADVKTTSDSTVVQLPAKSMSSNVNLSALLARLNFRRVISYAHNAVTMTLLKLTRPLPAVVRTFFINLTPKTFNYTHIINSNEQTTHVSTKLSTVKESAR